MKKVAIPSKMEKFYGAGTMLHPDKESVEELLAIVPLGKVATIDSICQKLARDNQTNVTCPMRTGNFVKRIIESSYNEETDLPFWRIIRKNYMLINSELINECADRLREEGFEVRQNSKGEFTVLNAEKRLFNY